MNKTMTIATLGIAGVFGTGYAIGGLSGVGGVFASSTKPVKTHVATKATKTTLTSKAGTAATTAGAKHADGTVAAVNGDTITVKADADHAGSNEYTGVTTIVLTGTTAYNNGATKASISVGSHIMAEGTVSTDGTTLTATSVGAGGHGGPGGYDGNGPQVGPHADGTVSAVNGDTLQVSAGTDANGSSEYTKVTTVILNSSTTYEDSTTKAALVAGADFSAEGTLSADGTTLTATKIEVRGADGHNHG